MPRFFSVILDFLFPLSPEAQALQKLSADEMSDKFKKAEPLPFPFITALFSYKDPMVKELIKNIKTRKDDRSFKAAAVLLNRELSKIDGQITLVPIPLSKSRRRERGYNQCEALIDEIIKLAPEKYVKQSKLLERARDRGEQKLKDRSERLRDSTLIFKINPIQINSPIVLIDDVVTTGSTLKEARAVLLGQNYKDVRALAIAH